MPEFKFRRLEKWRTGGSGDEMLLAVPAAKTPAGMVLRWCPNEECTPRRFQLGDSTWTGNTADVNLTRARRTPGTDGCTCPYCGKDADDDEFTAPEDISYALEQIQWAVEKDADEFLKGLAGDFNRSFGKGGLIDLKMEVDGTHRPEPKAWRREDLLRLLSCNICGRGYGVYAIGLFCPDCGSPNFANHFSREVSLIIGQLDVAEQVSEQGERELSYRMLGNAHEDVVTAFETYLKSAFHYSYTRRFNDDQRSEIEKKLRGNPFQRVKRSEELYRLLEVDLFKGLTDEDRTFLHLNVEKRHVVGHNLGIADDKYVEVAQDAATGETVTLLAEEIERFASLCRMAIETVEAELKEFKVESPPA